MPYRLYRRDPVVKGGWYYVVTCKGCGQLIYLLDDPSQGRRPVRMVGDGEISVACQRCQHDDLYPAAGLRSVQSSEDVKGARPQRIATSPASRKPLWRTFPKAKATFGVGYIEDRPAAAAIVGRIVTAWADIEIQCARLLAELMGTNVPAAAAVFGSLRSSRAQNDALTAAADTVLSDQDGELFAAHMARRSSLEKERNDLAHGCFGVSAAIRDHVIWVAQTDYISFTAGALDADGFRRRQFVYELGTLERIAQEIEEFYNQLGSFRGYLSARHDGGRGAAFRAERYPQLCSQPHIQTALDRIRTAKRAAKAPPEESPEDRRD